MLCFVALVAVTAVAGSPDTFDSFVAQFGRSYTGSEREHRRTIFEQNLKKAAELQAVNPSASFGLSKFSDWTDDEYIVYVSGRKRPVNPLEGWRSFTRGIRLAEIARDERDAIDRHLPDFVNISRFPSLEAKAKRFRSTCQQSAPMSWDWRSHGVVTSIKDQGTCGSCWAFSATANVESVTAIAGQPLQDLSEQEFVSCVPGDAGCGGGSYVVAWRWLLATQGGGMTSNADYPYVSANGYVPSCPAGPYPLVARIQDYVVLPANDESNMAAIVASKSPISVGVDAMAWKQYTGGVMTSCPSAQIDHCVVIVGYDLAANPPYWIIKNSFGVDWGESGYIRLQYGQNTCLVSEYPATATVGSV